VASGKWQVASGKWQKMPQIQLLVKHNMPHFTKTSPLSYPHRRVSWAKTTDLICSQDPRLRGDDKKVWAGMTTPRKAGFTLIELSIVLVIIGLLVGGILVGRDLIKAAEIRAQISQIEKYNTAVRTFQLKYGALPGDIAEPNASAFGFAARGSYAGQGDGNGIIEGVAWNSLPVNNCGVWMSGEIATFWRDLSTANLIDGNFNTATTTAVTTLTAADIPNYLPKAKIGNNVVSVWGSGCSAYGLYFPSMGENFFSISSVSGANAYRAMTARTGLSVQQAYNIDTKIDDGLPQLGSVLAVYMYQHPTGGLWYWAGTTIAFTPPYTTATPASTTTCFDNGNVGGAVQKYSVGTNGGNGLNCALSFKFQ
jgi:prepilin-type N-terminal cleavage/methylation domain-containing protein